MKKVSITIKGEPKGKARPRFSNTRNGVRTYTPYKTALYENMVSWTYVQEAGNIKFEGNIKANIKAFFSIPKSTSKKKREEMEKELTMYAHKPDTDNIAKIILDSLNGIAYDDDRQITELHVTKHYSKEPRVEVELTEVNDGNGD